MLKKKYKFNLDLDYMPPGFIMGDIKGVVMHPYNDVSEQGCIIGSGDEIAVVTKDGEIDSQSSGIMSIPSNEVWFLTSDGLYYDPMHVQIEEEYGDTFPDLPTFDREKTQAANTGSGDIYKWVFTEDVTRINDHHTGMFTEDGYYCTALPISKVFLPVNYWLNALELEPYLVQYCTDLESFTIPNSVTSIGDRAFFGCSSLTSITIPNSVTSIGSSAFYNCSALTSINIPESVTSIGSSAFYYCSSLTSITIPNSVTSIGDGAFSDCKSLASVTILNSVTSIGYRAFYNCSSLTSITIPNSVTSIGDYAFANCSSLTSITIPNSVTSIGNNAFANCSSLTSITIPNSVTNIGVSVFNSCSSLTSIVVEGGNTTYDSHNNCNAIIETATNTLIAGCQNTIIPNSVTSIGDYAFANCSSLTSITIPNSVTSIGNRAFYHTSLTSITLPNSVTSIGYRAFYNCDALTSITCEATTPPTLGTYNNLSNVTAVYVPAESVEAYKTATNWSYYSDIIQAIL